MGRGAWSATVHGSTTPWEVDMTEPTEFAKDFYEKSAS